MLNGAKILISSSQAVAFSVRPRGLTLTASVLLQFCARGQSSIWYGPGDYLSATTTLRPIGLDGNAYELTQNSQNGVQSQISYDGSCFTAHATLPGITQNLDVDYFEVGFQVDEPTLVRQPCVDPAMARLEDGSCVPGQNDPDSFLYFPVVFNQSLVIFTTEATSSMIADASFQFVGVTDVTAPEFTLCPANQTLTVAPNQLKKLVSWPMPEAKDDVRVATILSKVSGAAVNGSTVSMYFSVAQAVHEVEYVATDDSGNTGSCK